jgi:hypothetical protein
MICDGCSEPGALGLCAVHVHRSRSCAEQARRLRGGGRFETNGEVEPPSPLRPLEARLMRAVTEYVADWRREHSNERGSA